MASSSISSALLPTLAVLILSSFFITTSFSLPEISDHKPYTNPLGFTTLVIHRDSPESPFYDPKLTDADRWRNTIHRSLERYNHYTRNIMVPNGIRAPITYRTFEYVLSFHIGTPPVPTYSIIDTGSDLTWLQCRPCDNCYDQEIPIFDPSKSTSYAKVGCENDYCKPQLGNMCDKDGISCRYKIVYTGKGQSQGILSTETFTFLTQDGTRFGNISVPSFPFGCGENNSFPEVNGSRLGVPGVFGLNMLPLSWMYQLSFKAFSHCFVPKSWKQTSLLRFGQDAIITANSTTPMVDHAKYNIGNYYLRLEGVSVGKTKLNIPNGTFEISQDGKGGVIVDSGTGTTHLTLKAFDPLVTELAKQIKLERVPPPAGSPIALCYKANVVGYVLVLSMPDITFHFSGLNFVLQKWNVWIDVGDDKLCLSIVQSTDELTLIGAQHLQNVNVGYDLKNKVISLFNKVCNET